MNAARTTRNIRPSGRPGRWLIPGLAGLAGLALVFFAYELGQIRAGYNRLESMARLGDIEQRFRNSEDRNRRMRERIAILETDRNIKAEAYRQVELQLADLQSQIVKQQEDLAFYRGIVSSDQDADLRIQDFELSPGADSTTFLLQLVLAQTIRNNRRVSGRAEVAVTGSRNGEQLSLGLAELGAGEEKPDFLEFSFRYFQNLKTTLVLPPGFSPDRVTVRLMPKGKAVKGMEKTYDWPSGQG